MSDFNDAMSEMQAVAGKNEIQLPQNGEEQLILALAFGT
jgi:hypothetical protein